MDNNLIFLNDSDLNKSIYRVFSFKRLREIFQDKKLTLVKPKTWDDPFENFILNSRGVFDNGQEFEIGFRENFYGQCWSLTEESDAMWRIYSPKKDGVKVKTTIRALFNPLFSIDSQYDDLQQNHYNLSAFVGKVKYASIKTLKKMLNNEALMSYKVFDQTGRGQASTFYFKRVAFKHENEIRIMYNAQVNNPNNIFKFDIEPNSLFEEIVFDPRMSELEYNRYKDQLLSWGYLHNISQSNLYKIENLNVRLRSLY